MVAAVVEATDLSPSSFRSRATRGQQVELDRSDVEVEAQEECVLDRVRASSWEVGSMEANEVASESEDTDSCRSQIAEGGHSHSLVVMEHEEAMRGRA